MSMIKKILGVIVSLVLVGAVAYISVPLKDALFGVPFAIKEDPEKRGKDWFESNLILNCNRLYLREVGMIFEPPIPIKSVQEASNVVSGEVKLVIIQGGEKWESDIDLESTGWAVSSEGLRFKVISRFEPLSGPFCIDQRLMISAKQLSIDLEQHSVSVYVSRDRRP